MAEMRKRTSMSVLEMGRMLGLGKTESYWLIKKNYFKTILPAIISVKIAASIPKADTAEIPIPGSTTEILVRLERPKGE